MSVVYNLSLDVNFPLFQQNFGAFNIQSAEPKAGIFSVSLAPGTVATPIDTSEAQSLGLCFARAQHTSIGRVFLGRMDGTAFYPTVGLRGRDAALFRLAPGDYGARADFFADAESAVIILQIMQDVSTQVF